MINFDFITLSLFLKENIDFLQGARIQKIQQPTRQELIFGIRGIKNIDSHSKPELKQESRLGYCLAPAPLEGEGLGRGDLIFAQQKEADNVLNANRGESRKFYININPKFFHICFMGGVNEKKRLIEIPKQPPMFCMLLRKYLEGAKISKIVQPPEERILEFYFETYNELSEKIYLCLAIELMGKHSNVVLYNYDTNVIIGSMHNVGAEKSREREIIGGLPYTYPPKNLNRNFLGFSTILKEGASVNETIDDYFSSIQEIEKIKNLKSRLLTVTKTKLRKANSALEKIQKQTKTFEKTELYRKKGDLIMANLYNGKDFLKSIEVVDYETNEPLKIILDETKTLVENANQYYKLYNKAKTALLKSDEMTENFKQEKDYIEQILYSIEEAKTIEDLLEIDEEEGKMSGRQEGKKKPITSHVLPLTLQFTVHGSLFTVFVGKNNKQNDYVVSKLARSEDMWFHTHNCAGSHVLLRVEAGQKVTDEIIFECAKLAKEYSSGKLSSKVGVIYTKAKNLKKPPGANLGYVIYKDEKEIIVD